MDEKTQGVREIWVVSLFLLAFLIFNVITATSYPFAHLDECLQAEPAINYIHGLGFGIRFDEILGMWSFLLVPWTKLFGSSLEAIRSADIVSMTAALLVLWSGVKRLEVVPGAFWRVFLLVLLATEYGMIAVYRNGRYDGFGALVICVMLWLMSIQERRTRLISLFAASLLIPWAGLQFMPVLFTAGVFLLLIFHWRFWREITVSFLASGLGVAAFFGIAAANGRLPTLLKFISVQRTGINVISDWIHQGHLVVYNYIPADFSLPFLLAATVIVFVHLLRRKTITLHSGIFLGILFDLLLSIVMLTVAKLPTYYSYMVVIPLGVALCSGLAHCEPGKLKNAALTLCCLSAIVGAGVHAAAYLGNYRDRDYSRLEQFVERSVRADDIAYADVRGYLAVRQRARDAYFPETEERIIPLMSQQQKDSITVLLIPPSELEYTATGLGGHWEETGQVLAPTGHNLFGNRRMGLVTFRPTDLTVYRRHDDRDRLPASSKTSSVKQEKRS
jgi:hypothetical protein